jgi:hypothetical protein
VLVIADHSKTIGLAGVMGGVHSGIGPTTSDVLLEVAYFTPEAVAGRETSAEGEMRCHGWRNKESIKTTYCRTILRYKLSLGY